MLGKKEFTINEDMMRNSEVYYAQTMNMPWATVYATFNNINEKVDMDWMTNGLIEPILTSINSITSVSPNGDELYYNDPLYEVGFYSGKRATTEVDYIMGSFTHVMRMLCKPLAWEECYPHLRDKDFSTPQDLINEALDKYSSSSIKFVSDDGSENDPFLEQIKDHMFTVIDTAKNDTQEWNRAMFIMTLTYMLFTYSDPTRELLNQILLRIIFI